jgi:hypothetical protein
MRGFDASTSEGYKALILCAVRQAAAVEICWAMMIRTRPKIGSSVGSEGQRCGWSRMRPANLGSREVR